MRHSPLSLDCYHRRIAVLTYEPLEEGIVLLAASLLATVTQGVVYRNDVLAWRYRLRSR